MREEAYCRIINSQSTLWMPVSWRTVGNLWYTDWNGYYIASPMILKIMRKQKRVMFEVRKCRVQNLAYTLSIVMDNNIHVLHNNKDEKDFLS